MDVTKKIQFPSKTEFELYCQRVAVAVGYLSIRIFGLTGNKAKKICIFFGYGIPIDKYC